MQVVGRDDEDIDGQLVPAAEARRWWRYLMDNALGLVEDAHTLLVAGSAGRAQALQVLAMEELAKAVWLYDAAAGDWTARHPMVRVGDADKRAHHLAKLTKSLTYEAGLRPFWGDFSGWELLDVTNPEAFLDHVAKMLEDYQALAAQLNDAKQAGLYVDRLAGELRSPAELEPHGLDAAVEKTAEVIMMALIRDQTRMKLEMPADAYDDTSDLQWRAMELVGPDAVERFRN